MRKSILVAGLIMLTPAISQAKTLEELLVEKGVITKGEAASASEGAPGSVTWKNGNRISDPSEGVTANVATQLQERYTFTDRDEDAALSNSSSFETKRARLIVSGTALHEEFSYVVQTDFVGTSNDGAKTPELRDAYIKWAACDWVTLKMGQFKTGISRQFNTSSAKLQFVDRSVVSDFFDLDRQQGISASTDLADGMIEVGAAMFNGESDGEGRNRPGLDTKHTSVVNLRVNAMGKMDPYEEGDVNWTEDTAVTVGAAYAHSSANNAIGNGDVLEDADKDTFSVDANLKSAGLSVNAEYFYQNQDADSLADSIDANGFYIQAGYFLDPKVLEIAARYALLDCDDGRAGGVCAGNDNLNQVAATINYYFKKHNLKAQFGYEFNNEDPTSGGDDTNTNKWIFQISAYM